MSKSEDMNEAMKEIGSRLTSFFETEFRITKELHDLPTYPVMLSIISGFTSSIFISLLSDPDTHELPEDWRTTYKKLSNQFRDQLIESVKPKGH